MIQIAADHQGLVVLPAHRLYYNDRWNPIDLAGRARQLLAHHIERCGAIVQILNGKPKSAEEIAAEYFENRLLEGYGILMATNEIVSHCELLIESGDVITDGEDRFAAVGSTQFEAHIDNLTADEIAQ
jgi:hypothetical protein